jgi:ubiquinone/menaquinone biosynthesis C-methylase UbiE
VSAGAAVFRRVQRYGWDAASAIYEDGWAPRLADFGARCVDRARLRPGERVLDLATGPGLTALLAGDAVGPGGRVLGLDIADGMIALASARARELGAAHVHLERRDFEDTGVPDGSFDAVLCAFGLMFAADRRRAFAELSRVLPPGGRVSLVLWGERAACGWAGVFPIVDAHVTSEVCPLFFSLGAPGELRAALQRAGFTDVEEERVRVTLPWPDADSAARDMIEGGAVALAWRRFPPAARAEVRAAYLASIEPFRQGDGYRIPSELIYATARKA